MFIFLRETHTFPSTLLGPVKGKCQTNGKNPAIFQQVFLPRSKLCFERCDLDFYIYMSHPLCSSWIYLQAIFCCPLENGSVWLSCVHSQLCFPLEWSGSWPCTPNFRLWWSFQRLSLFSSWKPCDAVDPCSTAILNPSPAISDISSAD
jgi:hypothetical protein